jgi:hypothetical protein
MHAIQTLFCGAALFTLAACGDDNVPPAPPPITPEEIPVTEAPPPPAPSPAATALRVDGFGDVRIGMTLAEAEGVLSTTMQSDPPSEGSTCTYAFATQLPGMGFMLEEGVIVRIDVLDDSVKTPEGVGVGSSEADVLSIYGARATVLPDKYDPMGKNVEVAETNPRNPPLLYVFETDGTMVTDYRAGRVPQVQYVEGCS